jgi:hypothetical protein
MDFLTAAWKEIIIAFVGAVIAGALTCAVQNKYENKAPLPCAKSGAIGGIAAGIVGILTVILQKVL